MSGCEELQPLWIVSRRKKKDISITEGGLSVFAAGGPPVSMVTRSASATIVPLFTGAELAGAQSPETADCTMRAVMFTSVHVHLHFYDVNQICGMNRGGFNLM